MIVVDASVLATALADDGDDGIRARRRLRTEELAAPELVELEVLSVFRRLVSSRTMAPDRAARAIEDLKDLRIRLTSHRLLLDRCWELKDNLTIYDAAYVALAELLQVRLLTADQRLVDAPGPICAFEVMN